jgi:HD-like signal output (HDOD) protein/CheY-like chemotaxis protein
VTATTQDAAPPGTVPDQPTVLFVDDEPHVLGGLRRMLRAQAKGWRMLFANSGEEALRIVTEQHVDAVVSDMRMPGMNGAQLLAAVQRERPATARIILSGQADQASVLAAVGSAQQFLAKPCDADVLVTAVKRALSVRRLLQDETLRNIIGSVESVPKPPEVYQRLVDVASSTDFQLTDVGRVLGDYMATSAEVLKVVNTAFFGLPRRVDSVQGAVNMLGLENVKSIVLATSLFGPSAQLPPGLDANRLHSLGLLRASIARRLSAAESLAQHEANLVGLAAMLRDVGLLVLGPALPDRLATVLSETEAAGHPLDPYERAEIERAGFGCSVAEASACLLGLWGFPDLVIHILATQPVDGGNLAASPAEHVLTASDWRATLPDVPIPSVPGGFVSTDRAQRWNAACDEVLSSLDEAGTGEADPAGDSEPAP